MKDDKNFKWTMEDIAHQYKTENSEWTWKKCWAKARVIYQEINKLNNQMWKNNSTYYRMNTPFSFYESEDGEWSSIPELEEV